MASADIGNPRTRRKRLSYNLQPFLITPPPTPPQIGMAPAPPVSSRVSDTPDVLPQPTPSTDPSDVRFGNKRFPDQADAAGWQGNAASHSPEEQGEPILNEPLMTPLSKPDTMEASGEIH